MCEQTTIEGLATCEDTPGEEEFATDWVAADEQDGPFAAIEEQTPAAFPAFFPTMSQCTAVPAVGPQHSRLGNHAYLAVMAAAISLFVHVGLAGTVFWVVHARHTFAAAHPQAVQGDGATVLGAIDHNGNDQAPGDAGPGSLTLGWSAPPRLAVTAVPDVPPAVDASDVPPPASAPPPPDPSDTDPAPAQVAPDVTVNPLQPDMLPVFARQPPEAAPLPATAPVTVAETQPAAAPLELSRRGGPTTGPLPTAVAAAKPLIGNDALAMTAGFPGAASDKHGGLLNHAGPSGSNGKGGAVTGDGGSAVTGRPGTPAGVKGRPLHADYPDDCRGRGETGRVVIAVDVRADGSIASVKVLSDDGHPRLAEAALEAFQGRTFAPALLDGRPVRSTVRYPFLFELH